MKVAAISAAVLGGLLPMVQAHYFFDALVIDGQESKEFVRGNTRGEKYNPTKWVNSRDNTTPDGPEMRCNKGGDGMGAQTKTADVKAGAKLAMKLAVGATFQHPGPAMVYAQKAQGSASQSQGDGDWFKIAEMGVCNEGGDFLKDAWCTWDKDRIEFTIPQDMPDGEYLIRSEHIGLHGAQGGQAEFYMGCSQIKVSGGSSGGAAPGPTVKFPGAYKKSDPEVNFNLWSGYKPYTIPGPAVWGSSSAGGNAGASQGNASQGGAPQGGAPQGGAPQNGAPQGGAPQNGAPQGGNGGFPQGGNGGAPPNFGGAPPNFGGNGGFPPNFGRRHARDLVLN